MMRLLREYGADTLDLLITNKLVELEAEKAGIKIKDEEIQKEIDVMVESYGDEKSLKEQLEASGSSMDALKKGHRGLPANEKNWSNRELP
ncbi:SurA N-terminal domain-containing protein [Peribacillus frigoritolerans]|nr:SurA N-terminal domain-containing protein [Peribacillus frigoritolerans]